MAFIVPDWYPKCPECGKLMQPTSSKTFQCQNENCQEYGFDVENTDPYSDEAYERENNI